MNCKQFLGQDHAHRLQSPCECAVVFNADVFVFVRLIVCIYPPGSFAFAAHVLARVRLQQRCDVFEAQIAAATEGESE